MADNSSQAGTDLIRDIDKGGVKTQVVTLDVGGAGAESLIAGTVPVSGSVSVSNFPATQPVSIAATVNTNATVSNFPATQAISAASLPLPTGAAADGTDATGVTMPTGGVGIRGWLSSIYNKLNTSVAVTGTFWQATQPVSIAATVNTNTGLSQPLTDTQLRATAVPVSGTFFQATQPVSLATNTPTLQASTNIIGKVGIDQTTPGTTNLVQVGGSLPTGTNTLGSVKLTDGTTVAVVAPGGYQYVQQRSADLIVSSLGTANTLLTVTVPAVASQFHYITAIEIIRLNPTVTAVAAAASVISITTTNLPGSLAWSFGNAIAAGASEVLVRLTPNQPIKSSVVNTATTIVCPAGGAGVQFRVNVYYYTGT